MDMTPDEIVVRYRQAKEKGKQLNILAQLNACSVDDIVQVLVDHGGYKLERMSRSRSKAKLLKKEQDDKIIANLSIQKLKTDSEAAARSIISRKDEAIKKIMDEQLEKSKNMTPIKIIEPMIVPKPSVDSALDVLRNEIEDINRQQYELDQRKADLYKKLWDMLGGVS